MPEPTISPLKQARLVLALFYQAQDAACDEDGDVIDTYRFDAAYSAFGEDALAALEALVTHCDKVLASAGRRIPEQSE